jgi:hypothetical protein
VKKTHDHSNNLHRKQAIFKREMPVPHIFFDIFRVREIFFRFFSVAGGFPFACCMKRDTLYTHFDSVDCTAPAPFSETCPPVINCRP